MIKLTNMRFHITSFLVIVILAISSVVYAEKKAVLIDVTGAIGPAVQDYIQRSLDDAAKNQASVIILRLDTPGGLETSMRGIDKAILSSPVPVVAYVAPQGARAASAGTFIMYASQIAAMAPGTNIGAASPVNIGGIGSPGENKTGEENKKTPSTEETKAKNDAAAYIRSLAEMHHRNAMWAEQAVLKAASLSSDEALKQHVIDVIANDPSDLLNKINGKTVTVQGTQQTLQTAGQTIETVKPDWRYQFLSIITDPSVAYILLLIGIYGLFFEFYNPGLVLPGVAGAICLLLALYAFQLLPINYTGFALLLLGLAFMITEVFISSFGILGIGGIIAFIVGSIFLLDTKAPGFTIAWQLILLMSVLSAVFFLVIIQLAVRSMRKKVVSGREALIGSEGVVLEYTEQYCSVRIQGEIWRAESEIPLHPGQKIRVKDVLDLILKVEPI